MNTNEKILKVFYRFMLVYYQDKYCLHISANTCCKGVDIAHVGPGAKLFGHILIADNTIVGANAVVNKNLMEGNIAIGGIPARKISDKGYLYYHPKK